MFGRLRFKPEEGHGGDRHRAAHHLSGPLVNYQIVDRGLEPAGVGALMALLEERKKKLAAEGLFDEARKQLIAVSCRDVIGVVDVADRRGDPRHPASPVATAFRAT